MRPVFYTAWKFRRCFCRKCWCISQAAAVIPEGPELLISAVGVSPFVIKAVRQTVAQVSYLVEVLLILDSVPVAHLG